MKKYEYITYKVEGSSTLHIGKMLSSEYFDFTSTNTVLINSGSLKEQVFESVRRNKNPSYFSKKFKKARNEA